MWLALLLPAAPSQAARALSLLTCVAGDYAAAVGAGGKVISAVRAAFAAGSWPLRTAGASREP